MRLSPLTALWFVPTALALVQGLQEVQKLLEGGPQDRCPTLGMGAGRRGQMHDTSEQKISHVFS